MSILDDAKKKYGNGGYDYGYGGTGFTDFEKNRPDSTVGKGKLDIDCTHLVYNVLQDAGYKVGYTQTGSMIGSGYYDIVTDVKPGDIIYFPSKDGKPGHVGFIETYDPVTKSGTFFGSQSKGPGTTGFGPDDYYWNWDFKVLRPKPECNPDSTGTDPTGQVPVPPGSNDGGYTFTFDGNVVTVSSDGTVSIAGPGYGDGTGGTGGTGGTADVPIPPPGGSVPGGGNGGTPPGGGGFNNSMNIAPPRVDPLMLDLDGDGIETTHVKDGAYFDHDGNGFAEQTGWVGHDDGLLVMDRNGDGLINSGKELFGDQTVLSNGTKASDGFQVLAELDGNADGKIEINDAAFSQLKVWQDFDGDGDTFELLEAV